MQNGFYNSAKDITNMSQFDDIRKETINIIDEDGNIYYERTSGTVQTKDWLRMMFEINKNMLNKKLFLNARVNGEQYTSELLIDE